MRGSSSRTGASRPRPARSTGIATTSVYSSIASASASGVCTLPWRTGRSAVASYSSIVITFRAWTRNSSGGVVLSRRPRRPYATSGCLLTCSATLVALDEPSDRVDRDRQHAVHVRRVEVVDLARTDLVDAQAHRAGAHLAQAGNDVQRRGLHVVADDAGSRPHLELGAQVRPGHLVGDQVRVERVDRAHDPEVVRDPGGFRRFAQRLDDVKRRHRRVFLWHVAVQRALAAHGADCDHQVARLDPGLERPTGAY